MLFVSTNLSPFNQLDCEQSLYWNCTSGQYLEIKMKMLKVYIHITRRTKGRLRQAIRKAHLSSRSGDLRTLELDCLTHKLLSNSYFPFGEKRGKCMQSIHHFNKQHIVKRLTDRFGIILTMLYNYDDTKIILKIN